MGVRQRDENAFTLRIDEALFDGAPDMGAVSVAVAAKITVIGVAMGVKLDQPHRAFLGNGAQDGKRDQVIATCRHGHHAGSVQAPVEIPDLCKRFLDADRVDRGIAEIRNPAVFIG